jgi:hypothetical protein
VEAGSATWARRPCATVSTRARTRSLARPADRAGLIDCAVATPAELTSEGHDDLHAPLRRGSSAYRRIIGKDVRQYSYGRPCHVVKELAKPADAHDQRHAARSGSCAT